MNSNEHHESTKSAYSGDKNSATKKPIPNLKNSSINEPVNDSAGLQDAGLPKAQSILNGVEQLEEKWLGQIENAKRRWNRLSTIELKNCEGNADELTRLLQKYYSISRMDAEKEVDGFLRDIYFH